MENKIISVGDRVQVINKASAYYGATGIVKKIVKHPVSNNDWFLTKMEVDNEFIGTYASELKLFSVVSKMETTENIPKAGTTEKVPLDEVAFEKFYVEDGHYKIQAVPKSCVKELQPEPKKKHAEVKYAKLSDFVVDALEAQIKKFAQKNKEYKSTTDELSNFSTGANLRYKKKGLKSKYKTLKDYLNKHISKVYDHGIEHPVNDSWEDIIVYAAIALYMRDCWQKKKRYKE